MYSSTLQGNYWKITKLTKKQICAIPYNGNRVETCLLLSKFSLPQRKKFKKVCTVASYHVFLLSIKVIFMLYANGNLTQNLVFTQVFKFVKLLLHFLYMCTVKCTNISHFLLSWIQHFSKDEVWFFQFNIYSTLCFLPFYTFL